LPSNNRVLIIGIDSLEINIINNLISSKASKGFSFFFESGSSIPLRSTFPPDTLLAWPTIYTGLLPQRFGLKPEPESPLALRVNSYLIRNKLLGRTFWDIASKNDKKVCIVNPIFAYPPWKVNGLMVTGPSFGLKGPTISQPTRDDLLCYRLGTYGRTPLLPHEYKETLREAVEQLKSVLSLAYKLFNEDLYDIMFVADYTLDRIQHYYWRYCDPEDPLRPKFMNTFKDIIINYYRTLDCIIWKFIDRFSDDYIVIVLGDHGHSRRPLRLVSIDKLLNPKVQDRYRYAELFKHLAMLFAYYARIDNLSFWFIRKMQGRGFLGRLMTRKDSNIIIKHVIRSIGEFGLKEFVGLKLYDSNKSKESIDKIKKILINSGLAETAFTPHEYYDVAELLEFEADLYVKLKEIGNLQSSNSFLTLPNFTRRIISGGHSMFSVFLAYDSRKRIYFKAPFMRVQDVAPSILSITGLRSEIKFDGLNMIHYE
jgi:predicted AlkP superfamily phosphohydrolase/phosphomutase